jgi:thiol-disulfide isomerase/thioredoxin
MMKKSFIISTLLMFSMSFMAQATSLNTGPWRFELKTVYGTVPFVIEINRNKDGFKGILKNGKEKIELTDIVSTDQGISIPLQSYELSLEMRLTSQGKMTGYLVRHNKNPKIKTPIAAIHGKDQRFLEDRKTPEIDLDGRWAITLTDEEGKIESGVIVFEQKENNLHGSIMTPTGDYRYLEGFVSGNEFQAASFDGVYNYLLKGKVLDNKLEATILSNYKTKIQGKKDSTAKLPDAYKQTQLETLNFEFPDLKGNKVSIQDEKFKNKPVIVQFFGSWCPNCLDEMNYLVPWYLKNQKRGIEIVALAFERSLSPAEARIQLLKTQKKYQVPYDIVIAGSTSEDKPADKIPGLKNFISFPTTIFLNKKHQVVKVHAGFTGPSTGEFFEKWKSEFNQTVNDLVK